MVTRHDAVRTILTSFPQFEKNWQKHLIFWGGEDAGLCNDLGALSRYIKELISNNDTESLPEMFSFIEKMLTEGNDEVRNATATCVLENLMNATPHSINPADFVPLLGAQSRKYCQSWDCFTGVKTEGLE